MVRTLSAGVVSAWLLFCVGGSTAPTELEAAALKLIAAVPQPLQQRLCNGFDAPQRLQWSYLPGARPGVKLGEMDNTARAAAHHLLRTLLSVQGYLKVTSIMALEPVLAEMERAQGGTGSTRDAEQYCFAIYGQPGSGKPWAFRVEGHHVVITFTSASTAGTAVTPMFLGTHPAEVPSGPSAGLRILAAEEDLALKLMALLDAEERAAATISQKVPGDIAAGPARKVDEIEAVGLALSEMEEAEIEALRQLVRAFTANFPREQSDAAVERVLSGDLKSARFAWWGAAEARTAHAWRLRTATSVMEFDNREPGSGHVHLVWRDAVRDHGADLLQQHLHEHHGEGH